MSPGTRERTSMLTLSMTSRNTSFLRYLIPCGLHETALVTSVTGRASAISSLYDSCVMYLRDDQRTVVKAEVFAVHALLQHLALCDLRVSKIHHLV